MQKVDPFIPVSRSPKRRRTAQRSPSAARAVDGFMPGPQVLQQKSQTLAKPDLTPAQPQSAPAPAPRTYTPARSSAASQAFIRAEQQMTAPQPRTGRIRRGFTVFLQLIALLTLFGVGFLLRSLLVGEAIIVLYAVFAFIFRVESRTTFIFVLISFGVVLTASLRSDTALASVFAVYAFLLLVVGTISLGREVRNEI